MAATTLITRWRALILSVNCGEKTTVEYLSRKAKFSPKVNINKSYWTQILGRRSLVD
jgi:hypothetical protein